MLPEVGVVIEDTPQQEPKQDDKFVVTKRKPNVTSPTDLWVTVL